MSPKRGASTCEIAERFPPRRQYFREKQREYRRKMIADGATFKAQCVHLQSVLVRLQTARPQSTTPREASDGPLSWHSIAKVFKGEAHRVLTDRQSLVAQIQELQSLTKFMQRFVMINIPPPMSRSNAWQNAILEADPSARNLAKEWLTQQMYHNMHEAFALLPAVSYDDDFFQFDIQASHENDDPFTLTEQLQFTWPGTVQMFRRLVETNMQAVHFTKNVEMVVEEKTSNTRMFHTITPEGIFVNSLERYFVEANRFVVVMRQVEHDEAHLCDTLHKQRHGMSWTEVRQVSPTHILMRIVSHSSHFFRPGGGLVSVDELSALWGIDMTGIEDDGLKDEYMRCEMIRRSYADFLPWRQRFMGLMHQSATN
ncbi:hypothetical protein H257_07608 [Aphanomyces astaci]|uniref:Uncharacterized protein n=1 Tax=Aphanomyces astaci TaxID=112090 RepID=W4GHK9_APHAT|nr:hypothetical protein H257_07608 [Aphanomyces astaci]ETV78776.1 hypothetical protein H257_07608 [Aphanomyces astaci]|eukprot:XP_009831495.1 hypothetical protein H257_07608 [Aphanomyces astaci]